MEAPSNTHIDVTLTWGTHMSDEKSDPIRVRSIRQPRDWAYKRPRISKDDSRSLTLLALEELTNDPLSGSGPIPVSRLVDRFSRLEAQTGRTRAIETDSHTIEIRVRRSLNLLGEEGKVSWVKGTGFVLARDSSASAAIDVAIRRLRRVQQALNLPPSRMGTWPESAWKYALWSVVDAIPLVERNLSDRLRRELREPTKAWTDEQDPLNPFPVVELRGTTTSLPLDLKEMTEGIFAGRLESLSKELCEICVRPLPHDPNSTRLDEEITVRLKLVDGFDPSAHAHPACSEICQAYWLLDYFRRGLETTGPKLPDWAVSLPPAPRVPGESPAGRQGETQTSIPLREGQAHPQRGRPSRSVSLRGRKRRAS